MADPTQEAVNIPEAVLIGVVSQWQPVSARQNQGTVSKLVKSRLACTSFEPLSVGRLECSIMGPEHNRNQAPAAPKPGLGILRVAVLIAAVDVNVAVLSSLWSPLLPAWLLLLLLLCILVLI